MAKKVREYENHKVLDIPQEAQIASSVTMRSTRMTSHYSQLAGAGRVLAVDPGIANCAVAIIDFGEGTQDVYTAKIVPPTAWANKPLLQCLYIQKILEEIIVQFVPAYIAKEGPAYGSIMKSHDLGRAHQAIDLACVNTSRPIITVAPPSVRSFVGSASKAETRQKVYKTYGIEFPSDDEADAFAIGMTAQAVVRGEYPRPKPPKPTKKISPEPPAELKAALAKSRKKSSAKKSPAKKAVRKGTRR